MVVIIVLIVALVAFLSILLCDECPHIFEFPLIFLLVIVAPALFLSIVALPINRMWVYADIHHIEAVRESIEIARDGECEIERATIQINVADANALLARHQYYNTTVFDIWIPDAVMDVEPIK